MNKTEKALLVERMHHHNFGVEVEMAKVSVSKAITIVCDYFGKSRSDIRPTHHLNGQSITDNKGRKWVCEEDHSSSGSLGSISCELVTPILTLDDMPMLQQLLRIFREKGAKSGQQWMCGIHCHVDGKDLTPKSLRNCVNLFASHEDLLKRAINISRTRETYCEDTNSSFIERINNLSGSSLSFKNIENCWYYCNGGDYDRDSHYNTSRYHKINLHSFFHGHGTIEFRLYQFHGEIHAGELKSFVQLSLAIVEYATMVSRCGYTPVDTKGNDKYAMVTWLKNMGLVGDEFKTARTLLCKRLSGDMACLIPRTTRAIEDDIQFHGELSLG